MNWTKTWSVAWDEIGHNVRQSAFYISLVLTLVLFVAAAALPRLQATASNLPGRDLLQETTFSEAETFSEPVGYVDLAGVIQELTEGEAPFFLPFADREAAEAGIAVGEISGYYLIPADYIEMGQVRHYSLDPQLLDNNDGLVSDILRRNMLIPVGPEGFRERVTDSVAIEWVNDPPATFRFVPADLDRDLLTTAAVVAGIFAYMLNAGGFLLLGALQRETDNRVLELILTSVSPEEFIGGKLIGLTLLAFVQLLVSIVAGWFVYQIDQVGTGLSTIFILVAIPYLVLGYFVYGSVMVGVAAILPNLGDSMQLQFVFRLLYLSPVVGAVFILPNPHSLTSIWLTMIPITSPLLMPFRVLLTDVPAGQLVSSLLILLAWMVGMFVLSTRLFRANAMLTGRSPSFKMFVQAMIGR